MSGWSSTPDVPTQNTLGISLKEVFLNVLLRCASLVMTSEMYCCLRNSFFTSSDSCLSYMNAWFWSHLRSAEIIDKLLTEYFLSSVEPQSTKKLPENRWWSLKISRFISLGYMCKVSRRGGTNPIRGLAQLFGQSPFCWCLYPLGRWGWRLGLGAIRQPHSPNRKFDAMSVHLVGLLIVWEREELLFPVGIPTRYHRCTQVYTGVGCYFRILALFFSSKFASVWTLEITAGRRQYTKRVQL